MRRTAVLIVIAMTAACQDAISGPPPGFRSIELATVAEGVSGTAGVIDQAGANSNVTVTLRGLTVGASYTGKIVQGSCASPGADAAALNTITAQNTSALGATAGVPDAALTSGHALLYARAGNTVVCGNL